MKVSSSISMLVWTVFFCVAIVPLIVSATSPYLQSREAVYIVGAMGGIIGLSLMFVQPILAGGYLPAVRINRARRWHRIFGVLLCIAVLAHIIGLYLTSPMDMTDALLLAAPTAFSVYGVIALWSLVATLVLVAIRSRLHIALNMWKLIHNALAVVVVVTSTTHALMIEGLMEQNSKIALCFFVLLATLVATVHIRAVKK